MFRYRLYEVDGTEAGEATYPSMVKPGETIRANGNRELHVVDVVPIEDESDEYAGLLMVEATLS